MDWFAILGIARSLSPNKSSTFTAYDLNKKVRFPATEKRTGDQIASAWIGKLQKWGYVERVGSAPNPGHKSIGVYAVTEKGRKAENTSASASEFSDFDELREAVRGFEVARGEHRASMGKKTQKQAGEKEEQAFVDLIALCNKYDREEFGVQ